MFKIGGIDLKYNLYLFDFDYTIANSEAGIVKCFQYVLNKNGITDIDDNLIKNTIGYTLEESFEILTGIEENSKISQFKQQYIKKADEIMTPNTYLFPDTTDVLKKLKEFDLKLGIVSTKLSYRIYDTLKQYGITDLIDIVIGGAEVTAPKPNPEGILTAIEKLNSTKQETLYIGDSIVDAKTAQNADVDFVAVTTGVTDGYKFEAFSHIAIIPNLSSLLCLKI